MRLPRRLRRARPLQGLAQDEARTRPTGWGRLLQGRSVIAMGAVALLALTTGLLAGRLVVSPADAARRAEPPAAGLVTVPVERRVLSTAVVTRGDAVYADRREVTVTTGDLEGSAVVTGRVPEVGALVEPGTVVLEVAGRPVIALSGDLPVYRSLSAGTSGPDVAQLKAALAGLGIDAGGGPPDAYDEATATAVAALYARAGYPPPPPGEDAEETVDAAEDAVAAAEQAVVAARVALTGAGEGATAAERAEADAAVRSAERGLAAAREGATLDEVRAAEDALALARAQREAVVAAGGDPAALVEADAAVRSAEQAVAAVRAGGAPAEIAEAEDALVVARAARDELLAAPDVTAERAALAAAEQELATAREDLADGRRDLLTALPASEVVTVPALPRRVDAVAVRPGAAVEGPVLTVSGATLVVTGTVRASDAALVAPGAAAVLTLPDGTEVRASVTSIGTGAAASPAAPAAPATPPAGAEATPEPAPADGAVADGAATVPVVLTPEGTPEELAALAGAAVRISIPVGETDGAVLAVPPAALTAGPGGEARVEVARPAAGEGVARDGAEDGSQGVATAPTTLVEVVPGLSADGLVEVTVPGGGLAEGDLVVVGRG